MLTYQDFLEVGEDDSARIRFIQNVIFEHKASQLYKDAVDANEYYKGLNVTATKYEKMIRTITGKEVPDRWSPNHRTTRNFFRYFVDQLNQFLLGNGATWNNNDTPAKLGNDFDNRLQELGREAQKGALSFGLWNLDHVNCFSVTEFAPLWDEHTGALRSGVRFWQIDNTKPLRATLYEEDGYTEYIWDFRDKTSADGKVYSPKRPYKVTVGTSQEKGTEIIDGENYPGFPIIPMWANPMHISELAPIRTKIDAYDLMMNGFLNDLDSAQIFWVLKGAGGMDDEDMVRFLERLHILKVVDAEEGQDIQPVTVEIPHEAREKILAAIKEDLYKDAMALDLTDIKSGNVVVAQIQAAYEPLNTKADAYEYCVLDFIKNLLKIAQIEDECTFTRSSISNKSEEISNLVAVSQWLPDDYITSKVLTIFGDADQIDDILKQMAAEEIDRFSTPEEEPEEEPEQGLNNG